MAELISMLLRGLKYFNYFSNAIHASCNTDSETGLLLCEHTHEIYNTFLGNYFNLCGMQPLFCHHFCFDFGGDPSVMTAAPNGSRICDCDFIVNVADVSH